MTVKNTIEKYNFYLNRSKQMVQTPAQRKQVESDLARVAILKKHMLSSVKYKGHAFLKELAKK